MPPSPFSRFLPQQDGIRGSDRRCGVPLVRAVAPRLRGLQKGAAPLEAEPGLHRLPLSAGGLGSSGFGGFQNEDVGGSAANREP